MVLAKYTLNPINKHDPYAMGMLVSMLWIYPGCRDLPPNSLIKCANIIKVPSIYVTQWTKELMTCANNLLFISALNINPINKPSYFYLLFIDQRKIKYILGNHDALWNFCQNNSVRGWLIHAWVHEPRSRNRYRSLPIVSRLAYWSRKVDLRKSLTCKSRTMSTVSSR